MKAFIQKYLVHSLIIISELCIGILLLIDPVGFTRGILMVLGALVALLGLWSIVRYFTAKPETAAREQTLARGLGMLLLGAFCLLDAQWFVDTFPALTMVYGLLMLLAALYKVQRAADALRLKMGHLLFRWLSAAVTLCFGFVILANPFASSAALWIFTGISLILLAGLDAAVFIARIRPAAQTAA